MEVHCPVCGSKSALMARHPEADLYRCLRCTHAFSHLDSIPDLEPYQANYFDGDHKRWFENPNTELFRKIAALIPKGASVLDAGCGPGHFLQYLHKIRPDLKLCGIDLIDNPDVEGIRFLKGDIAEVAVNETFDAVVSLATIEHLPDVAGFADRLRALTKPNGIIAVMTVNESSILYGLARAGRRLHVSLAFNRLYSRHHLNHFTRESLRTLLRSRGLIVSSEMVHNPPLAAIDIPVESKLMDALLRTAMWTLCKAGDITNGSHLQTIICRAPAAQYESTPVEAKSLQ
jgi:2-polyprenyl-3-methyl-5-hydroxy-6-metoxy-1,4-benzoquinol methylase